MEEGLESTPQATTQTNLRHLFSKNFVLLLLLSILFNVSFLLGRGALASNVYEIVSPSVSELNALSPQRALLIFNFSTIIGLLFGYAFGGILADRFGKRTVLIFSSTAYCLALAISFVTQDINWLTLTFSIALFAAGVSIACIFALICDVSSRDRLTTAFGIFEGASSVVIGLVYMLPRTLASLLFVSSETLQLGYLLGALLLGLVVIVIAIRIGDVPQTSYIRNHSVTHHELEPKELLKAVFVIMLLVTVSADVFRDSVSWTITGLQIFPFLRETDPMLFYGLAGFIGGSQIVGGIMADKFGKRATMLVGGLAIPFVGAFFLIDSLAGYLLAYTTVYLVYGISGPAYPSLLAENTSPKKCASILGLRFFFVGFTSQAVSIFFSVLGNAGAVVGIYMLALPMLLTALSIPVILVIYMEPLRAREERVS